MKQILVLVLLLSFQSLAVAQNKPSLLPPSAVLQTGRQDVWMMFLSNTQASFTRTMQDGLCRFEILLCILNSCLENRRTAPEFFFKR